VVKVEECLDIGRNQDCDLLLLEGLIETLEL
jgi:hypothetical protein